MQQRARISCWSCQLVYPGQTACDVCGGLGQLEREARMADRELSHELLQNVLRGLDDATGGDRRAALIAALIAWQLYGAAYVAVEYGLEAGAPAFGDAHARLRDRLVDAIRAIDAG